MTTLQANRQSMNEWRKLYNIRKLQLARINRMYPSSMKAQLARECFKGINFTRNKLRQYAKLVHSDLYSTIGA